MTDIQTAIDAFPIRELARRTGVKASTLRAWESRHDLLQPRRTPTGHRVYDATDVERILAVRELLAEGHGLAEAVQLLNKRPVASAGATPADEDSAGVTWSSLQAQLLEATAAFSSARLDTVYGHACAMHAIDTVNRNLLIPTLQALGERWQTRPTGIAEEHFFSAWVRNKLGAWLHHSPARVRGPRLVCACLPGEIHEIGLLIFALSALAQGYQVIYLGANMPLRQIAPVVEATQAKAVVLSGRSGENAGVVIADIAWLSNRLAVPVFVGSHFARVHKTELAEAGASPIGDDITIGLGRVENRIAG